MENPFVSVVIPTYNRDKMLRGCLESLLTQTYPKDKYETIVVDDGSTDRTREVVENLAKRAEPIIKYFYQKNQGQASARNLGIENAKGEIIGFIDDDCIASKNWIINLTEKYSDEKVGGVGGKIVGYNLKTLSEKYIEKSSYLSHEKYGYYFATANASYRKEIFQKVGAFDEFCSDKADTSDVDISIRVLKKGYSIEYSAEAIVYHKHPSSIRGLLRRSYLSGIGLMKLTKKYELPHSPLYLILWKLQIILYNLILVPFTLIKLPITEDKAYFLAEPLMKVGTKTSSLVGIMKEAYLGKPYEGRKIRLEQEFLMEILKVEELNSFSALLKKIKTNLISKISY